MVISDILREDKVEGNEKSGCWQYLWTTLLNGCEIEGITISGLSLSLHFLTISSIFAWCQGKNQKYESTSQC